MQYPNTAPIRHVALASALAVLTLHGAAAAQDPSREPRRAEDRTMSIEVQARLGAGGMWIISGEPIAPFAPLGHSPAGHLGASISARHFGTGLGATVGYSHVFAGTDRHYGTHSIDLRLSERFTFLRARRRGHPVELSIFAELGPLLGFGGATQGCWNIGRTCDGVDPTVSATIAGVVAAVGFLVQYDVLLIGVEGDYRHVVAIEGPIARAHEAFGMVRVGLVADL